MSSWSEDTEEEKEKLTGYVSHTPYLRRKYKKGSNYVEDVKKVHM